MASSKEPLSPAEARELGRALLDAADECERPDAAVQPTPGAALDGLRPSGRLGPLS